MIVFFKASETAVASARTIDELFRNGIEHDNALELMAEETVDQDSSLLIGKIKRFVFKNADCLFVCFS